MFRYPGWRRTCNEGTGTPLHDLEYLTDSALLVVLWPRCYNRRLCDAAAGEMVWDSTEGTRR
jgi:hypothetical protein